MGENKKYYWLKLKEDFFRQKEIKKLRKIAGGDTYTIIYLKMQLLSLKNEGRLYFEALEDTFIEEIALEIDEEVENVKITVLYLLKHNLLEELKENEFLLYQAATSIGSETQGAERVRRFRDKTNSQKALLCNADVTNCNTEIEKREKRKELEKEKDIEPKKEKKKNNKGFDNIIKSYTDNEQLKTTIIEFIKMRKAIKKPLTDNALEIMLKKLNKLSSKDNEKIDILEQSIMGSWQGIFELKAEVKAVKHTQEFGAAY